MKPKVKKPLKKTSLQDMLAQKLGTRLNNPEVNAYVRMRI